MNLFLSKMLSVSIVLGVVGVNNQNVEANLKKNNTLQIKNEKNISLGVFLLTLSFRTPESEW